MLLSNSPEEIVTRLLKFLKGFSSRSPSPIVVDQTAIESLGIQLQQNAGAFSGQSIFKRAAVFCVSFMQHSPIVSGGLELRIRTSFDHPIVAQVDANAAAALSFTLESFRHARLNRGGHIYRVSQDVILSKHAFHELCDALFNLRSAEDEFRLRCTQLLGLVFEQAVYVGNVGLRYNDVISIARPAAP